MMIRFTAVWAGLFLLLTGCGLLLTGCGSGDSGGSDHERAPRELFRAPVVRDDLAIQTQGYPRAFFFRVPEAYAARSDIAYEDWAERFSRLNGIAGKCLGEEELGAFEKNLDWFVRFKRDHPEDLVLLHFDGIARDPRFEAEAFHPGHWLYVNGCKTLAKIEAEPGRTVVRVEDPSLFLLDAGYTQDRDEDLGLCAVDANGKPDWNRSEQVIVRAVDLEAGTVTLERGAYGTAPQAFEAGAYLAAHATNGPIRPGAAFMWVYNLSTACPKDPDGKTCADVLVEQIAGWFAPDGKLAVFDGLELDVSFFNLENWIPGPREVDVDADGVADCGLVDGVDAYGVGVYRFHQGLRDALGDRRFVMADGTNHRSQRSVGVLGGLETEGWPSPVDQEIRLWSAGINRHLFWRERAVPPVLNYIVHKDSTNHPERFPDSPFAEENVSKPVTPAGTRLVLAGAALTDSGFSYVIQPQTPPRSSARSSSGMRSTAVPASR